MRSIQQHLAEFEAAGVRPVAISADPPETSKELARKAGYTFLILSDTQAETIRRYDLLHAKAGVNGADISRPAEFLLDRDGTVRWLNLTENYWVRARAEQMLSEAKKLR